MCVYVCAGYVTRKNNGFFFHFTFQRIRVFSAASVVVVVVENLWLKYLYWKINKYTNSVCVWYHREIVSKRKDVLADVQQQRRKKNGHFSNQIKLYDSWHIWKPLAKEKKILYQIIINVSCLKTSIIQVEYKYCLLSSVNINAHR